MPNAPLSWQVGSALKGPELRAINREYHLELTAKNTGELRAAQAVQMRMQAEAAVMNLRAMGEINRTVGGLDGTLISGFDALAREIASLNSSLGDLDEHLVSGFNQVDATLRKGFSLVAQEIIQVGEALQRQQMTLNEIAHVLHNQLEAKVQELLREGLKWLEEGEKSEGREQMDYRKDALRIFDEVIRDPKGATNFIAWFNAGYVHWRMGQDTARAEECFYQARRLSAPNRDAWHTKGLRHEAEMQYLQGKFEEAWTTIQKALAVEREYESLYNAARYASKAGRKEAAMALLDECIDRRPTTIMTMYSEEDFLG